LKRFGIFLENIIPTFKAPMPQRTENRVHEDDNDDNQKVLEFFEVEDVTNSSTKSNGPIEVIELTDTEDESDDWTVSPDSAVHEVFFLLLVLANSS
jgi:hypothetical protein